MEKLIFTRNGFNELQRVLGEAQQRLNEATQLKAETGADQDGWHDEGWKLGNTQQMMWSKRVEQLQRIAQRCEIVEPSESSDRVAIGNGVEIEYIDDGTVRRFIVEGYLASPGGSQISIYSPLGKALRGAREDDERSVVIAGESRWVRVARIVPPSQAAEFVRADKED